MTFRCISRCFLVVVLSLLAAGIVMAGPAGGRESLLSRIVCTLADSTLAGRGNGSEEMFASADFIVSEMAASGLQPCGQDGWFQDFPLTGEGFEGLSGRNVLGGLAGCGELADRWIVVGAHYDHLGRTDDGRFYPGADDNASGVAALVQVAAGLQREKSVASRRSILFVAFAGEEIGLLGSSWLVRNWPFSGEPVDAMLNLDTIGRLRRNRLYVGGAGTGKGFSELVERIAAGRFDLSVSQGGWDASDHVSFNAAGIPVLFLFTGPHADYHQPSDTASSVDIELLHRVASFAGELTAALASLPDPLVYQSVPGPPPVAAGEGNRNVWFGSIPDFSEEVTGLRLAGVIEGGPAEVAGLQRDDLLLSMAGKAVQDIVTFTRILRSHAPGDTIVVEYVRDEILMTVEVVVGDRSDRRK